MKRHFTEKNYTDGKLAHEKMFNIISHERNANEDHNELSLHLLEQSHNSDIIKC